MPCSSREGRGSRRKPCLSSTPVTPVRLLLDRHLSPVPLARSSPCATPAQARGAARVGRISASPACPFTPPARHPSQPAPTATSSCCLLPELLRAPVRALLPGHRPVGDTLTRPRAKYRSPAPTEPLRARVQGSSRITTRPSSDAVRDPPSYERLSGLTPSGCLLSFSHPGKKEVWGNRGDPREVPVRPRGHAGSGRLFCTGWGQALWLRAPGTSRCWSCWDGGGSFPLRPGMSPGPWPRVANCW